MTVTVTVTVTVTLAISQKSVFTLCTVLRLAGLFQAVWRDFLGLEWLVLFKMRKTVTIRRTETAGCPKVASNFNYFVSRSNFPWCSQSFRKGTGRQGAVFIQRSVSHTTHSRQSKQAKLPWLHGRAGALKRSGQLSRYWGPGERSGLFGTSSISIDYKFGQVKKDSMTVTVIVTAIRVSF